MTQQTSRDPGTDVRNIFANSSHPTDPSEPATAAPTGTSAQTAPAASASNEQSQVWELRALLPLL